MLAGLVKVLKDLPHDDRYRTFFEQKFRRMAQSVVSLQQPEGYWTRSLMDPAQAPGPETSGTAFFCYGLMWGINNGLLSESDCMPVVNRAWKYLSTVAVQSSGKVGYVQPIGEKTIPGQYLARRHLPRFWPFHSLSDRRPSTSGTHGMVRIATRRTD